MSAGDMHEEIAIGTPSPNCACCREPFTAAREPRMNIRLYPVALPIPLSFSYPLCGDCGDKYRRGGAERKEVAVAVAAFHMGDDPQCA